MLKLYLGVDPGEDRINALKNNLSILDQLIGDNKYVTGDQLTIADLTILANTWVMITSGYDLKAYPNFKRWITGLESELKYFDEVLRSATKQDFEEWAQNKDYLKKLLNSA